jgi:Leucine-rich repeat (LRR) protein
MSTFKSNIEEVPKSQKHEEVEFLILDECKKSNVSEVPVSFVNLKTVLANLLKLDLSDNKISEGIEHLCVLGSLTHLLLSGNKIHTIAQLTSLAALENLHSLELLMCDVNRIDNYREKVFKVLPKLKFIDGKIIGDKIVYVAKFVPRNQRAAAHKVFTNCYVKDFGTYLDEQIVSDLFGTCGCIVSAKVIFMNFVNLNKCMSPCSAFEHCESFGMKMGS